MNTNNTNKDYSARVKSFNDYAEIVRREKIRIKQIELENQLLKEQHLNKPSLDEMAKQLQLVYNFFNQPPKPKKKKLTENEKMELMMEEQNKKIEFAQLQNLVKQGKLNI